MFVVGGEFYLHAFPLQRGSVDQNLPVYTEMALVPGKKCSRLIQNLILLCKSNALRRFKLRSAPLPQCSCPADPKQRVCGANRALRDEPLKHRYSFRGLQLLPYGRGSTRGRRRQVTISPLRRVRSRGQLPSCGLRIRCLHGLH